MKRIVFVVLALLAVGIVGWRLSAAGSRQPQAAVVIPTAEVTHGTLVVTLPVNGALESAEEIPVRAEIAGNLVQLCEDNSPVRPGDFIFQLDTKTLEDERDGLVRALNDAEESLSSAQADGEVRVVQAQSDADAARESHALAVEKAGAEVARMDAQVSYAVRETARAQQEYQRAQRLAKLNYIAGTKLRDAKKTYDRKQFDLEQQKAEQADLTKRTREQIEDSQASLDLALLALATARANAAEDVEGARIRVAEAQRKLSECEKKIQQCTVNAPENAPVGGMAVIGTNTGNWPERRPYRIGDQVGSGSAPVTIYNLAKMQVRCQIGEMDVSRVRTGQDAFVRPSAGSGIRYRGKVTVVEELAQEANIWQGGTPGKKVFSIIVSLSEADPTHLRPGMTADLEIVLGETREALMAPIRTVFTEKSRTGVYRARGEQYEEVPVKVGTRNDLSIEIIAGVKAGDKLALERPPAAMLWRAEGRR